MSFDPAVENKEKIKKVKITEKRFNLMCDVIIAAHAKNDDLFHAAMNKILLEDLGEVERIEE